MGNISLWGVNYVSNIIIGQTGAPLSTYYMALINGDEPSAFISGSELQEITVSGYGRVAIPNNSTNWASMDYGRMKNLNVVSWAAATANWGRVRSWALCDAATHGNVIFYGNFAQARLVQTGDIFLVNPGALRIHLISGSE